MDKATNRSKPVFHETPAIIEEATTNYRVLPIFEESIWDQSLKEHYSMVTNHYLRCHWQRCVDKYYRTGAKRSEPLQIPYHGDFHFCNGEIKYRPKESVFRRKSFKYQFKAGPGFDYVGEIPIPNELQYVRAKATTEKEEPVSKKLGSSNGMSKTSRKDDKHEKLSRAIPVGKVEKKMDTRVRYTSGIPSFGRPLSAKRAKKGQHNDDKHKAYNKTTIKVTEEATVKVNEMEHKIVVQNKCTVAVHNRRKSTLI